MGIFVVTGATSGIGKAIAERLSASGHRVYGVGRSGGDGVLSVDLKKPEELERVFDSVKEDGIDGLINAAGCAYYGLHETINPVNISEMVDVNIKAPMVLTKYFLPKLRKNKGIIVNISSVTAKSGSNTHGVAYGATKAALTSFGESLFEEVRKHGVRVVNIHPDLTDTNLYRHADFGVTGEPDETLFADDVAEAVMFAVNAREGLCVSDVTVKPQRFKIKRGT